MGAFFSLSPEQRKSVYKFVLVSDLETRVKQLENKIDENIGRILNEFPVCDNLGISILSVKDYWCVPTFRIIIYSNYKRDKSKHLNYNTFHKDAKIGLNKHQYETLFN